MIIQGSERKDISQVHAGDIAALVGLRNITTGDTLCDEDFDVTLEPPTFPEPVISMAVEPKTRADRDKMSEGLQRLAEEDPTFRCFHNEETGQLIIAGMGELHLEIICDRLKREFKVDANTGAPQIAYRETITKPADGEGKFIRQSGGRGQYGHACIQIQPNEKGKGIEVENKIVGGAIPKEYIPAVIDGIEEAIKGGVWRVTRSLTSRRRWWTARSTKWTRTNWRSRWRAFSRSRTPSKRPARFCSSPS